MGSVRRRTRPKKRRDSGKITANEALDNLYSLVRNIVKGIDGYTINDVLDTDYDMLMGVLFSQKSTKQDAVDLADFIKTI